MKIKTKLLFLVLIPVVLLVGVIVITNKTFGLSLGTTYYIDSQIGSNSNLGTSSKSPWQDFTNINKIGKFKAGDKILLARGCSWDQELILTGSGKSRRYIEISAYGSGDRPKIIRKGNSEERCIYILNGDYWDVNNLELGNAAVGLHFQYKTLYHEGIRVHNLFVHDFKGIYNFQVFTPPDYTERVSIINRFAVDGGIKLSAGILISGFSDISIGTGDYAVRNVDIYDIEGTRNLNSLSIDAGTWIVDLKSGDGHNLYQNVVLNRLNFYNDDGMVNQGSPDSLRLCGITNLKIMNSKLDRVVGQHTETGTAAVFFGGGTDYIVVNNLFTNLPDTQSHDQTFIDYESSMERSILRGNYFAHAAGPAVEFLCFYKDEPNEKCINHELSSNTFAMNGVRRLVDEKASSIYQHANGSVPTGTIRDNIYYEPGKNFLTGNFSKMTVQNNTSLSQEPNSSMLGFSDKQGLNSWSYKYKDENGKWVNFPFYDSRTGCWSLTKGAIVQTVGQFELTPGIQSGSDVARVWTAPHSGIVSIRGCVLKSDTTGGNGVNAKITHNGSVIWGTKVVTNSDRNGYETNADSISVSEGDTLSFEINNNGNSSHDTTSWVPTVAYTSTVGKLMHWGFDCAAHSLGWRADDKTSMSADNGLLTLTSNGGSYDVYSPNNLGADANEYRYIKVKMKNDTDSSSAFISFMSDTDTVWSSAKSVSINISSKDSDYREYTFDMGTNPNWKNKIRQLHFQTSTSTGRIDIDSIIMSN